MTMTFSSGSEALRYAIFLWGGRGCRQIPRCQLAGRRITYRLKSQIIYICILMYKLIQIKSFFRKNGFHAGFFECSCIKRKEEEAERSNRISLYLKEIESMTPKYRAA